MRPLATLPPSSASRIVGLLFDLDDTLLSHGVLTRQAYDALWRLHDAGLKLVAVTGRPSGWGEVIVRQWPIDGAVTENGAVSVVRAGSGVCTRSEGTEVEQKQRRSRLEALVVQVAEKMPRVRLADDNHARRTDVTWDIGETERLTSSSIAELEGWVRRAGARSTCSSVHLHGSFERDDKASGAMRFVREHFDEDVGSAIYRWAFVGDSGNDAACFAAFSTTFGVANVRSFTQKISVPPAWISPSERGAGFTEIADALLAARTGAVVREDSPHEAQG